MKHFCYLSSPLLSSPLRQAVLRPVPAVGVRFPPGVAGPGPLQGQGGPGGPHHLQVDLQHLSRWGEK